MAHSAGPRSRRTAAGLVGLLLTAGGLVACSSDPPDATLRSFAAKLPSGGFGGLDVTTPAGRAVPAGTVIKLEGDLAGLKPKVTVGGISAKGDTATATLHWSWPVGTGVTWSYTSPVRAAKKKNGWRVYFEPTTLHPQLAAGAALGLQHTQGDRGSILDGSGAPITTKQKIITVRVQPNEVTDPDATLRSLDAALRSVQGDIGSIDLTGVSQAVKAKGSAPVDVISLRESVYNKIRGTIHELPGLYFATTERSLTPTPTFAKALLGRVGDVTKEIIDKNPGKYRIGDQVGLGGLQQRYDAVLGGTPGVSVVIAGKPQADGTAGPPTVLFTSAPKPGGPIRTTLDPKIQEAADATVAGATKRSAIVAIRVSDGAILADANGPDGGDLDLGLTAQVPPGSTFKTVTATGVLDNGSETVNSVVSCPKTYTAPGGSPIQNAEDLTATLGNNAQLHQDFAQSCNTAFAQLGAKLGADGLATTARTLGIGVPWDLGAPVFSGSVSTGDNPAEQAAAAFGQGKTLVSPAALAGAAAAIARGQWQQPKLVLDPAPRSPAPAGPQLKASTLAALKQMMREVVTDGTAKGIRNTPGAPIYGKTGTAQFDNNDPNRTHSWFIGFRGDMAFAVFVEDGGLSTAAAVPLAGVFLSKVP